MRKKWKHAASFTAGQPIGNDGEEKGEELIHLHGRLVGSLDVLSSEDSKTER
jgi:hypothetical protein